MTYAVWWWELTPRERDDYWSGRWLGDVGEIEQNEGAA